MIHIERTRKKTNVPEHTRDENTYVSTHGSRTKEDIAKEKKTMHI
jgi:hypothetical protein